MKINSMNHFRVVERLGIYLTIIQLFVLRIVLLVFITPFFGELASGLSILSLFIIFHLDIGLKFIQGKNWKKYTLTLPIILLSIFLISFKMMVNASQPDCFGGVEKVNQSFHYFIFYIWSSIFLWELYFMFFRKN